MSLPISSSDVLARNSDDRSSDPIVSTSSLLRSSSSVSYVDLPDAPLSVQDSSPSADSPVSVSVDETLPVPSRSAFDPSGVGIGAVSAAHSDPDAITSSSPLLPVVPVRAESLSDDPEPSPEPVGGEESMSAPRSTVSLGVQTRPLIRKRGTCL